MALLAVLTTVAGRVTGLAPSIISSAPGAPASQARAGYLKPPVLVSTVPSLLARHQAEVEATGATPSASVAVATPAPTPEAKPAYVTYTIQPGDTITSIAAAFDVDPSYILWNNHEVSDDPNLLLIGKQLLIPSVNGIVYNVVSGDTLSDIASYYRIDTQTIASFAANNLASPDQLSDGMVLLLPGAVPPPPPPAPSRASVVEDTAEPSLPVPAGVAPAAPAAASSGYIWPWYGAITTYFGEPRGDSYHRGIDIDGFGGYGAPIAAAADGTVVLATWDDWGLGYHVILQHADGSRTVYGHLSDIWVTQGQAVSQGEAVGGLGSTGYSTGAHLHFELWIGGAPVDPLSYLP